ncbi:MAG TPA: monovalent cation/H+ antiporter complex subunit F [Actinotalea sp.]|jgi:multicomponent Na+:H+ antiporter subunit F
MSVVVVICAVLLTGAAALAGFRMERGPSMLDRTVGLDVLTSTIVGAVALEAAWSRRTDTVPILVVLSMVGFVSAVTIARFAAHEPEGAGRVLTRDEVAQLEAQRLRAERDAEDAS